MKKTILSSLALVLFACNDAPTGNTNNQTTGTNSDTLSVEAEISSLNDLLKKYEDAPQNFTVSSEKNSEVKGNAGTKIKIDPNSLAAEDGQPLGKTIEVELKELTSTAQLLKNNAATMSDGKLLISGGAYYINMTTEGRKLKIKDGSGVEVEFPKLTGEEMTLFTGQRDSIGKMNWISTSETFSKPGAAKQEKSKAAKKDTSPADAIIGFLKDPKYTKEEKKEMEIHSKVYEAMKIRAFGWINCDRFADFQDKTDIAITIRPQDSISSANLYLVFSDINSIMQADYYKGKMASYNNGFRNVPVGRSVRMIAYTVKNDKILSFSSDIKITPNKNVTLAFKPTSMEQFEKLLVLKY